MDLNKITMAKLCITDSVVVKIKEIDFWNFESNMTQPWIERKGWGGGGVKGGKN